MRLRRGSRAFVSRVFEARSVTRIGSLETYRSYRDRIRYTVVGSQARKRCDKTRRRERAACQRQHIEFLRILRLGVLRVVETVVSGLSRGRSRVRWRATGHVLSSALELSKVLYRMLETYRSRESIHETQMSGTVSWGVGERARLANASSWTNSVLFGQFETECFGDEWSLERGFVTSLSLSLSL